MKNPKKLCAAWYRRFCLRHRLTEISERVTAVLQMPVRLQPQKISGDGCDMILVAVSVDRDQRPLASVRWVDVDRVKQASEPFLPRRLENHTNRLQREAAAYRLLSSHKLSPAVMDIGPDYLVNTWMTGVPLSKLLKASEQNIWRVLPACLQAIGQMHALGTVHLDLNCGNLLIHPDDGSVVFIDFEFHPCQQHSIETLRGFDYVRFALNLLKRRRAINPAMLQPERFAGAFDEAISSGGLNFDLLPAACFERIRKHSPLFRVFQQTGRRAAVSEVA